MAELAIIGGTGLTALKDLEITDRKVVQTPYGEPSASLTYGVWQGHEIIFLPRHGGGHTIPPHKVNYRANIWALHHLGVKKVLAIAAVGGITTSMIPASLIFPDQIIDYTWSRGHTFYESGLNHVTHIDFTHPYCEELRSILVKAASMAGLDAIDNGTYGATQGPRLETAAEIKRMEQDGCDIVGMTGMPEAALASELGLCYATCAVVANMAAGKSGGTIEMTELEKNLKEGMQNVRTLLEQVFSLI